MLLSTNGTEFGTSISLNGGKNFHSVRKLTNLEKEAVRVLYTTARSYLQRETKTEAEILELRSLFNIVKSFM